MHANDLRAHVEALAHRPRVPGTRAHAGAAAYILEALKRYGYECAVERGEGWDGGGDNLVAAHGDPKAPLVLVGAHYDSVEGSPGADDNASGVAALLEIARAFAESPPALAANDPRIHVEFVAFDQEELGLLGSRAYCRTLRARGANVVAMLSLEMLGFTSAYQTMVPGVSVASKQGDFLAVVADGGSQHWLPAFQHEKAIRAVSPVTGSRPELPIECVRVESGTRAAGLARLSDHGAFWDAGWPALLVTDTAFLRNPHYHMASDTPDTLDYTFLFRSTQKVADALRRITADAARDLRQR
jgi:Zn-dependent M28 family amino/carboxypeptidase